MNYRNECAVNAICGWLRRLTTDELVALYHATYGRMLSCLEEAFDRREAEYRKLSAGALFIRLEVQSRGLDPQDVLIASFYAGAIH